MTVLREYVDAEARELIQHALDETLVVEAAAGTGKTTELIHRIVRVLAEGRAKVDEIVAVTFTEKAAGELKLRLRERLEIERVRAVEVDARRKLDAAVQNLEEAHVSTIHGFCADLLRERPVEAQVDPLFRVLTEVQAARLFNQAFDAWFHAHLESPPEGIRRSLRRTGRGARPGEGAEDGPVERLRRAGWELAQWRDFPTAWSREPFDRSRDMARVVELVHRLARLSEEPSYQGDNLYVDTAPVRRLSRALLAGVAWESDADGLESQLVDLRRNRDFRRARKGTGPTYTKGVTRAEVLTAREALVAALDEFQTRADADLAAVLHDELRSCVDQYEAAKRREGALDFLDLLLCARNLIVGNRSVRIHFQQRFKRIFIDEFQDTDPLQAEILWLLAACDPDQTDWRAVRTVPGKLFIVGDPKQSIYRFRRADVDLYKRSCELLIRDGATPVRLATSFRGVPNLQRFVNAAFGPISPDYVPLMPYRPEYDEQPSVVVLPVPRPYAGRRVTNYAVEQSLPDGVGAWLEWLLRDSGWKVTERRDRDRRVPIEARHICLLFRRFVSFGDDVTRPYVDALEARGIKHLLVGGRAYHDREEIETLRAALMAIEWPDDQLSVFATLRGALFAVGDEELLEYRHRFGAFHPFRLPLELPTHLQPIVEALQLLRELHVHRNRRAIAETITSLLDRTRAHVGFVLRPGGEQALANVLHVADLARQYELEGGMSFRGFVDALQDAAAGGQAAEAPILEEGSDGVRLMTVHKAKGLEFPVVVLADITARLTPFEAGRHVDSDRRLCAFRIGGWSPVELRLREVDELEQEKREGERLVYVAATRARDLLVVPACGDRPLDGGWISPLNSAIYPPEDVRREQHLARGCPAFASKDSVLERPDGDPATVFTVCPGEHRMVSPQFAGDPNQAGPGSRYSVTWWSPDAQALRLGAEAPCGLRRDDLIVKDVDSEVLRSQHDAYRAWQATREGAISAGRVPSLDVITATETALGLELAALDNFGVAVEEIAGGAARPGGARFGTLVHALLAEAPLDATPTTLQGLARAQGRILGSTGEETAAAADLVARVLDSQILKRAAAAAGKQRCYREIPVTYALSRGRLVEGVVDLAFEDETGFTVVDFKTDREFDGALDRYTRQVRVYAAAIAAATGKPARGILMRV